MMCVFSASIVGLLMLEEARKLRKRITALDMLSLTRNTLGKRDFKPRGSRTSVFWTPDEDYSLPSHELKVVS